MGVIVYLHAVNTSGCLHMLLWVQFWHFSILRRRRLSPVPGLHDTWIKPHSLKWYLSRYYWPMGGQNTGGSEVGVQKEKKKRAAHVFMRYRRNQRLASSAACGYDISSATIEKPVVWQISLKTGSHTSSSWSDLPTIITWISEHGDLPMHLYTSIDYWQIINKAHLF